MNNQKKCYSMLHCWFNSQLKTIICYDACDHNGDTTVQYNNEEIVHFFVLFTSNCVVQNVKYMYLSYSWGGNITSETNLIESLK